MENEKPKNPGGRPTKLNDDVARIIIDAVGQGVPYEIACYLADICDETVRNWNDRGKTDHLEGRETIYAKFFGDIKKAEAKCVNTQVKRITSGDKDWQSGAWLLERRHREQFGKESTLNLATKKPLQYAELSEMTPEQLRALAGEDGEG